MAYSEAMKKALTQAAKETLKATVLAMIQENEAEYPSQELERPAARLRAEGPFLRKPVFNWAAKDNQIRLKHFGMEVMKPFPTRHYDMSDAERVPIIKKTG